MTSTQPQQLEKASGHARRLLAVLVGLLVSLALIVSGAAPALAQNVVGAQHQNLILAVGSQTLAAQTSIGADGLAQLRHVSATGVAADNEGFFASRLRAMREDDPERGSIRKGGGANDAPSWVVREAGLPLTGETAQKYAYRILDEKYGLGGWKPGPGSEFSQIVKWATRGGRLK